VIKYLRLPEYFGPNHSSLLYGVVQWVQHTLQHTATHIVTCVAMCVAVSLSTRAGDFHSRLRLPIEMTFEKGYPHPVLCQVANC